MYYEVGDKIRIREDLHRLGKDGVFDGNCGYDNDMRVYAGQVATITDVALSSYKIDIDYGKWYWTDDMIDHDFNGGEEKEERPMVDHVAVKQINRSQMIEEMYNTLNLCEIYHPTDKGLNTILDEWAAQKGESDVWEGNSILDILSKHPDYVPEKGYIVKSNEYDRGIDFTTISDVMSNLIYAVSNPATSGIIKQVKLRPWTYMECRSNRNFLSSIVECLSHDTTNMTWRGMSFDEVSDEYYAWCKRVDIIEETYVIRNGLCFDREEHSKMSKLENLLMRIRNWALDKISGMNDEELLQPMLIDDIVMSFINDSGLTIRGVRTGQKFNKVIIKILTETGIKDTWNLYNKETARLSDASSPTKFTRFTVLSANPLDYWRMSFGSSWSSCHTIDKRGNYCPSDGGDNYEGMHASGTESYMLDSSSLVMYTVDKEYEGSDYELEPKINRCIFHLGEGKFVMGRVYPQGTDGEKEVYRQWRQIFQQIISECMGVPNYWKTEKDRDSKSKQYMSQGTHYRDYEMGYCEIAGWSYVKPHADIKPSLRKIKIGAYPICPCCGERHHVEDNIECDECNGEDVECYDCGYVSNRENMHYIDGEWYCEECCFYCEYHGEWELRESYYVQNYGNVCEDAIDYSGEFNYCEKCGCYYKIDECNGITTEDEKWFCCSDCAERGGYEETNDGHWYPEDEVHYCSRCGAYVCDDEWDDELGVCSYCAEELQENEESEEQIA